MKRIDISPFNYRWHWLIRNDEITRSIFLGDDLFFTVQQHSLMSSDNGFDFELGFEIYEFGKIQHLCPSTY